MDVNNDDDNSVNNVDSVNNVNNDVGDISSKKTILFYTPFFDSPDFQFGFGQKPFLDLGCPVSNCYTTNNR